MEGNDFLTDHVLARLEVAGQGEVGLAACRNQSVCGPRAGGAIVASLRDFGPDGRGARILKVLGNPRDDGPLVRAGDDVVAAAVVVPLHGDGVTCCGGDKVGNSGAASGVADEVCACQVLDRIVGRRRADISAATVALVHSVDPGAIDSGVGGGAGHEGCSDDGGGVTHVDMK